MRTVSEPKKQLDHGTAYKMGLTYINVMDLKWFVSGVLAAPYIRMSEQRD